MVDVHRLRVEEKSKIIVDNFYARLYDREKIFLREEKQNFNCKEFYLMEFHRTEYRMLDESFTLKAQDLWVGCEVGGKSFGGYSEQICSICLSNYVYGDEVLILPGCRHRFHSGCLMDWCRIGKTDCPCCRGFIRKKLMEFVHEENITSVRSSSGEGWNSDFTEEN
jgi:hypothetical protein